MSTPIVDMKDTSTTKEDCHPMKLLPVSITTLSATLLITGMGIIPTMAQESQPDLLDPVTLPESSEFESSENTVEVEKALQAYVETSFDIEEKERQAEILRRSSDKSKKESIQKNLDWESKHLESKIASQDADKKKDDAASYAREVYKYGASPEETESSKLLFGLFTQGDEADDRISAYNHAKQKGISNNQKLEVANDRENEADSLIAEASKTKDDADKKLSDSIDQASQAKTISEDLSSDVLEREKTYQETSITANAVNFDIDDKSTITLSQKTINQSLVSKWNDYLQGLENANIEIPTLKELAEEDFLENNDEFTAYPDLNGNPTPQVVALASDPTVYVLPRETIETVSAQLSNLGDAYHAEGDGKDNKWSCSAFSSMAYGEDRTLSLDEMWESSKEIDNLEKLPGDTVFFGSSESGLHHSGTYLGGGMVVSSSLPTKHVSVESVGYNYFGVTRPWMSPEEGHREAPVKSEDSLDWECGGLPGGQKQEGDWVVPVENGNYDIHKEFGDEDEKRWKDDKSPGMEFTLKTPEEIAKAQEEAKDDKVADKPEETKDDKVADKPEETPAVNEKDAYVRASGAGTVEVRLEDPTWGNMVIVSHKDKMKTIYTRMDEVTAKNGSQVTKGETLGVVGSTGKNVVKGKDSLMFIMEKDGKRVDPREFLFPAAPDTATVNVEDINTPIPEFKNGYSNGKLPAEALCAIPQSGHTMRCEALTSFIALNEAYKSQFGHEMCVTDSYRSYEAQVDVKRRKGRMAATPGTSNHGWGLALDLCDSVNIFGSEQHNWMKANAHRYGWFHPEWAGPGGSLPEAWHWEHVLSKQIP